MPARLPTESCVKSGGWVLVHGVAGTRRPAEAADISRMTCPGCGCAVVLVFRDVGYVDGEFYENTHTERWLIGGHDTKLAELACCEGEAPTIPDAIILTSPTMPSLTPEG